jgi:hypothetical protein
MTRPEEIATLGAVLAVVGLVNGLLSDRSFRGRKLALRRGPLWVACRWFGLGLWSASAIAGSPDDLPLELAGLVGALILLFGTARTRSKIGT